MVLIVRWMEMVVLAGLFRSCLFEPVLFIWILSGVNVLTVIIILTLFWTWINGLIFIATISWARWPFRSNIIILFFDNGWIIKVEFFLDHYSLDFNICEHVRQIYFIKFIEFLKSATIAVVVVSTSLKIVSFANIAIIWVTAAGAIAITSCQKAESILGTSESLWASSST